MFRTKRLILTVIFLFNGLITMNAADHSANQSIISILFSRADLLKIRKYVAEKNLRFLPAVENVKQKAEVALSAGPWTVVDKKQIPPSGNKHDYMSNAKYWWPDPENPDGPYIRKDGLTNPHTRTSDKADRADLSDAVEALGLAYFFFADERYAKKAAELVRVWFLDEKTYMSPHLHYGQAIPNRIEGRPFGIIETRQFIRIVDAVELIRNSPHWTNEDHTRLQAWFARYLDWLLTSDHGKKEGSNGNNHETSYTLQVCAYAIFAGKTEIALDQFENHFKQNIIQMIEHDGAQPRELERTKSLHYSLMNLSLMMQICELALQYDINLYDFETPDGRSVRKAFDFLYPVITGNKEWTYQQIEKSHPDYDELFYILRTARKRFGLKNNEEIIKRIYKDEYAAHPGHLYWPVFENE